MIDASHETLEENIAITRRVVDRAHARGVSVEAELGVLGGVEEHIAVDEKNAMLTDPDDAERFVAESGCDSLAVAIGTSHGAYKFAGSQGLHFDRIAEIQRRLPGVPLVMHGSSSVPREEVERINAAGGTLDPSAKGVSADEFARAVPLGVTKVNIDTDGRLVWTRVHREHLRDDASNFDFRKPGELFIKEYATFVADKATKLLSAGTLAELRRTLGARGGAAAGSHETARAAR